MSVTVITLQEGGENVDYVVYYKWEDPETTKKYVLLLLKDFVVEFSDSFMDREQVIEALRMYEVKEDSYMLTLDSELKKLAYTEAMRAGRP